MDRDGGSSPSAHARNENRPGEGSMDSSAVVDPVEKSLAVKIQTRLFEAKIADNLILGSIEKLETNIHFHPKPKKPDEKVLYMKIRKPRATALLEEDGTLVILKCKDVAEAKEVVSIVQGAIKRSGQTVETNPSRMNLHVKSVSGYVDYKLDIKLEGLEMDEDHWRSIRYAPEISPFLVYRYQNEKNTSLLIFASGKMVLKNGASKNELQDIVNKMKPTLEKYAR